jgi:hypothetical protein
LPQRIVERLQMATRKPPSHDVWLREILGMRDYTTT